MEDRDRKILRVNRSNLVTELKPSELYDGLLSRGVFTQDMIDEIQSAGTRRDQASQLVRDLETRGKCAFQAFLECLHEAGQDHLANLLHGGETQPQPLSNPAQPVILPLPSYKMDANPCGFCLIINNVDFHPHSLLENRKGSDIDCNKLERRFKSLNFIVIVKKNLKQKQIKHELSALSKKDHTPYDCCVVVILSHGTEASNSRFPGAVYGVDGGPAVSVELITNYFNGQHCPSLQGKPKLFFIQACGGGEKDTGFEVSPTEMRPSIEGAGDQTDAIPTSSSSDSLSTSDEIDARVTLPTPSDILVSYSTFPGYVSWRGTQTGSWYIEILDRVLEENAATVDLVNMLMMVNDKVSQNSALGLYKQMPGSFNFLRMLLYFRVLPHLPRLITASVLVLYRTSTELCSEPLSIPRPTPPWWASTKETPRGVFNLSWKPGANPGIGAECLPSGPTAVRMECEAKTRRSGRGLAVGERQRSWRSDLFRPCLDNGLLWHHVRAPDVEQQGIR
ncbi:caspase-9-like [Scleropages formosus]|uniref:Caspase-9-like n=1 Tax=Scleropages formosus TaxID=113540 RepID=A0A0N8K1X1_SCLFO|nr:caspase-9-like [Scleropages formosus]